MSVCLWYLLTGLLEHAVGRSRRGGRCGGWLQQLEEALGAVGRGLRVFVCWVCTGLCGPDTRRAILSLSHLTSVPKPAYPGPTTPPHHQACLAGTQPPTAGSTRVVPSLGSGGSGGMWGPAVTPSSWVELMGGGVGKTCFIGNASGRCWSQELWNVDTSIVGGSPAKICARWCRRRGQGPAAVCCEQCCPGQWHACS